MATSKKSKAQALYTIEDLKQNNLIIFEAIMGSKAYGTSLPTSDTDIRGIFVQPLEDILRYGYVEQVADELNDIVYYEIKRFLALASSNNPNILELLFAPTDCILTYDPSWSLVTDKAQEFLTKQCKNSFAGYAIQQIRKARGYDKKMNWEEKEMVRKNVLDFCYILVDGASVPFNKWVKNNFVNLNYKDFGLANIEHAHDVYAMYRTYGTDNYPDMDEPDKEFGIVSDPKTANNVQLVSIPKDRMIVAYLTFNKDAYSTHCKRYKEYSTWLKERNEDRFKMNKEHGKNYDSKNMMHTYRLLNAAKEIAEEKTIHVRRPDDERKVLMKIRKGEFELDQLLSIAETKIDEMDKAFDVSTLPDNIEFDIPELLFQVRTSFYKDWDTDFK